jgi:thioredoxin-related protein
LIILGLILSSVALSACKSRAAGIYDPDRDPNADVRAALEEARSPRKHILLVVGGNWCVWCMRLDRFVRETSEVHELWNREFITVHVNMSPENENTAFLGRYPAIKGYPHIFVLDQAGTLLKSQDTGVLEQGKSYSVEKMKQFLEAWRPSRTDGAPQSTASAK